MLDYQENLTKDGNYFQLPQKKSLVFLNYVLQPIKKQKIS